MFIFGICLLITAATLIWIQYMLWKVSISDTGTKTDTINTIEARKEIALELLIKTELVTFALVISGFYFSVIYY